MQVQGVNTINNTSFGYNLPVRYANFGNMQELLENTGKKIFEKNPKEYQEWQQALSELRIKRFDATQIDNRFRPIFKKYNYSGKYENFRALDGWDKYLNSLDTGKNLIVTEIPHEYEVPVELSFWEKVKYLISREKRPTKKFVETVKKETIQNDVSKIDASISNVEPEQTWSIGEPSGSWFSACTYLVTGEEKNYLECYDSSTDVYSFFEQSFSSADNIRKLINKIDTSLNLMFMLKIYSILNSAQTMAKLSGYNYDAKEIGDIIEAVDTEIKNRNKQPQ